MKPACNKTGWSCPPYTLGFIQWSEMCPADLSFVSREHQSSLEPWAGSIFHQGATWAGFAAAGCSEAWTSLSCVLVLAFTSSSTLPFPCMRDRAVFSLGSTKVTCCRLLRWSGQNFAGNNQNVRTQGILCCQCGSEIVRSKAGPWGCMGVFTSI